MIIIFHLHVHLTHIVATLADGLDSEFFQCHVAVYNLFQSLYRCIHRTVSAGSRLKLLTGDVQSQAGNRTDTYPTGHLQVLQLHAMVLRAVGTGKHEDIVIIDIFFLICQF